MPMLMLNKKREGERQERVFVIDKEMGEREDKPREGKKKTEKERKNQEREREDKPREGKKERGKERTNQERERKR